VSLRYHHLNPASGQLHDAAAATRHITERRQLFETIAITHNNFLMLLTRQKKQFTLPSKIVDMRRPVYPVCRQHR
jgi:hypothetical protein